MRIRRWARITGAAVAVALVLAGCGGDDDEEPAAATPTETAAPAPAPEPTPTPTATPTPPPEAQTYVVESGDTLGGIAQRFGTTVSAIVEANGLEDPDRLAIGDELVIPQGSEPAPDDAADPEAADDGADQEEGDE